MMGIDRSALLCDLAETYGIYDYKSLPARTVAMLAAGLREDSRIKKKMRGAEHIDSAYLIATIADRIVDVLAWFGAYEENTRPRSLRDEWYGVTDKQIETGPGLTLSEFDKMHAKLFGGIENGN